MSDHPRRTIEIIHHFRNKDTNFGGTGVVATHTDGDSFIRLTTVVCSTADQYSKKRTTADGRRQLAEGAFIKLGITQRKLLAYRDLRNIVLSIFTVFDENE